MKSRFTGTRLKTARARRLRRDMTESEKKLWRCLQGNQICGVAFRRQHPWGNYVLDFYAPSIKVAVECDGGQHGHGETQTRDEVRAAWLERKGLLVLRYWNSDIDGNIEGVVHEITQAVERRKRPLPNPPLSGEGEKTK